LVSDAISVAVRAATKPMLSAAIWEGVEAADLSRGEGSGLFGGQSLGLVVVRATISVTVFFPAPRSGSWLVPPPAFWSNPRPAHVSAGDVVVERA